MSLKYHPGVGITITRANIAAEQARRLKSGEEPAEPQDIVDTFVPACLQERRHLGRAYRLMSKMANRDAA